MKGRRNLKILNTNIKKNSPIKKLKLSPAKKKDTK